MSMESRRNVLLSLICIKKKGIERRRRFTEMRRRARRRRLEEFQKQQAQEAAFFLLVVAAMTLKPTTHSHIWMKPHSSDWWGRIAMVSFQENDWLENFRMGKDRFLYVCNQLRPHLRRQRTVMRQPIPVEKSIAVAIW